MLEVTTLEQQQEECSIPVANQNAVYLPYDTIAVGDTVSLVCMDDHFLPNGAHIVVYTCGINGWETDWKGDELPICTGNIRWWSNL